MTLHKPLLCSACDEHDGHVLYTGCSMMDTMDMCCTRHLLTLVILSLYSEQSYHCLLRFYKYSVSTVYVSFCLPYSIAIFCVCLLLFSKEYFLKPLYIHALPRESEWKNTVVVLNDWQNKSHKLYKFSIEASLQIFRMQTNSKPAETFQWCCCC